MYIDVDFVYICPCLAKPCIDIQAFEKELQDAATLAQKRAQAKEAEIQELKEKLFTKV